MSRDAIGQAKGMLMEQRSISGKQVFDLLREALQRLNLKVRGHRRGSDRAAASPQSVTLSGVD